MISSIYYPNYEILNRNRQRQFCFSFFDSRIWEVVLIIQKHRIGEDKKTRYVELRSAINTFDLVTERASFVLIQNDVLRPEFRLHGVFCVDFFHERGGGDWEKHRPSYSVRTNSSRRIGGDPVVRKPMRSRRGVVAVDVRAKKSRLEDPLVLVSVTSGRRRRGRGANNGAANDGESASSSHL